HGHLIASQVMVDEESAPLVDEQLLHQRSTNAHAHRADHLAAGGPGIEDAARRAHRQHAAYAGFARQGMHCHLDEVRSESALLRLLARVPEVNAVLTGEWPGIRSRPEVERAVSAAHFSVGKIRRGGIDDQLLSHRLTQLYTGSINTSGRTIAAPLSARAGGYGIGGVTEDHVDLVDRNAEHLRSRLGEDGVTARADVGHVRFDSDAAIALKAHAS